MVHTGPLGHIPRQKPRVREPHLFFFRVLLMIKHVLASLFCTLARLCQGRQSSDWPSKANRGVGPTRTIFDRRGPWPAAGLHHHLPCGAESHGRPYRHCHAEHRYRIGGLCLERMPVASIKCILVVPGVYPFLSFSGCCVSAVSEKNATSLFLVFSKNVLRAGTCHVSTWGYLFCKQV